MDPVKNPFAPGAGSPPPELAGRGPVLDAARIAVARIREGRPAKSLILVGLRGVGKTVLLVRIREMAEDAGYRAAIVEAHEGKTMAELLVPSLRQILFQLDIIANARDMARRGLRVLKSFVGGLRIGIGDYHLELGLEPERGTGDSGDLEADLAELFVAIGEAAKAGRTAISLCIDELQYLNETEFSALIMAIHRTNQLKLPIVLVGAGLPQILGLAGSSKSYAERLFDFPRVGALGEVDAKAALQVPAESMGVRFSESALNEILHVTECYPYFLQQWGHESWNLAPASPISDAIIEQATEQAIRSLDDNFFRVRFDRCTPSEKRYLRALADLGAGPQRSGDIAERLGVKSTTVGPIRSKLITKGMIYSPQHGDTAFTVPMFDAYMRRAMPGGFPW
jgi:hypothetical protein